ncbi:SGNH hydrolase-type esterase domain-containing protein [Dendryphion nanum]|uniref:SGNH hydrolase-type esterase domain-containing protein n=1 Tax=Dendryphion nanum TaxID=256645 RepID=A0A9P9J0C6_9PLEO|nr:SGNH hydrolase-type esterase domain-containing protein [Dendryphion nanum]
MHSLLTVQALFGSIVACVPFSLDPNSLSLFSRDEDFNEEDLSFIQNIGAIGDSYSAGIGAGNRLGSPVTFSPAEFGSWKCSRYDNSYPYLINQYLRDGELKDFDFHSCSGAKIPEIIDEQLDYVRGDRDVMLLSGGGNDVEFGDILNKCIFQWFAPTKLAGDSLEELLLAFGEEVDPEFLVWFHENKNKLTRSCDKQLEESTKIIDSKEFTNNIGKLIDKAKEKLKVDGVIYYTGYAKFFDPDIAENDFCSRPENTWSLFLSKHVASGWIFEEPIVQTKENRKKLNDLVDRVNIKIENVIREKAEGDKDRVRFVNYDSMFATVGARFCQRGVDRHEDNRMEDLAFYPLNLHDPFGTAPFKRSGSTPGYVGNGTEEAHINNLAQLADKAGIEYKSWVPMQKAKAKALAAGDVIKSESLADLDNMNPDLTKRMSILPDGIGRTFHPTILGHHIIARLVVWEMIQRNKRRHGMKPDELEVVFEHSCTLGPQFPAPSGLQCRNKKWGAPKYKTTDGSTPVLAAIREFCSKRKGQTVEQGKERIYDRWDVSGWHVTKRQSLWLSATTGHFQECKKATIEDSCEETLAGGLQACNKDTSWTQGMNAQGKNCIEYAIEISPSVHEGDPPWNEHVASFPPPETVMSSLLPYTGKRQVDCSVPQGQSWDVKDAEAAIEQYCSNNEPYGGYDMTVVKGNVTISASVKFNTTDLTGQPSYWPTPYKDEGYCQGFDWKHKNSDDCKYAFRKMLFERATSLQPAIIGNIGKKKFVRLKAGGLSATSQFTGLMQRVK